MLLKHRVWNDHGSKGPIGMDGTTGVVQADSAFGIRLTDGSKGSTSVTKLLQVAVSAGSVKSANRRCASFLQGIDDETSHDASHKIGAPDWG
jgi:hypothetical protein